MDRTVYTDFIQPFQVEGQENGIALRGRMVRLGPALCQALAGHNYPPVVSRLLGETVAVALTLASSLKYQGVFILQTKSDGPIKTLMADVTSTGGFRCYAIFDEEQLSEVMAQNPEHEPSLMRLLGAGYLAFSVDQGQDMERYQGLTELAGTSLADCAHQYFQQSEQLNTAMVVLAEEQGQVSGTLMIQQLPPEGGLANDASDSEEDWRRAVTLMSSVTARELLDDGLPAADLLFRLFHEDGVRLYDSSVVRNECRCSEIKVRQTLVSFSIEEVEDLYENNTISVVCEFCKTGYHYNREDMASLREMA